MKNNLGKNMRHALAFAEKANSWHSFKNDRATRDAVKRLEKRGLVQTNEFQQFRLTPIDFSRKTMLAQLASGK